MQHTIKSFGKRIRHKQKLYRSPYERMTKTRLLMCPNVEPWGDGNEKKVALHDFNTKQSHWYELYKLIISETSQQAAVIIDQFHLTSRLPSGVLAAFIFEDRLLEANITEKLMGASTSCISWHITVSWQNIDTAPQCCKTGCGNTFIRMKFCTFYFIPKIMSIEKEHLINWTPARTLPLDCVMADNLAHSKSYTCIKQSTSTSSWYSGKQSPRAEQWIHYRSSSLVLQREDGDTLPQSVVLLW